jgi:anti-sigma-K factor RskA
MSDHVLHAHDGTSHDDDPRELIGAYVLHALDDDDRRRVEQLLDADPTARAEADHLDAAADQLAEAAASGASAPSDLLGSILSQAATRPAGGGSAAPTAAPAVEPVIPPRATRPAADGANGNSGNVVPFERPAARRPRGAWILSAAAVVVLVIVGGLVVANRSGGDDVPAEVAMREMALEAANQPGARTGQLTDADNTMAVQVIVDPQGHAFLMADVLPALEEGQTYQLWAAEGEQMVSLGLLGSAPTMSVVGVDQAVTTLALTIEPVGGSTGPTSAPMAQGTLSQA